MLTLYSNRSVTFYANPHRLFQRAASSEEGGQRPGPTLVSGGRSQRSFTRFSLPTGSTKRLARLLGQKSGSGRPPPSKLKKSKGDFLKSAALVPKVARPTGNSLYALNTCRPVSPESKARRFGHRGWLNAHSSFANPGSGANRDIDNHYDESARSSCLCAYRISTRSLCRRCGRFASTVGHLRQSAT